MIPCIVLAGPIGLGFGYMRWNSYILWSFAWCFSTVGYPGHSALEKRLLYDSIIMDEHFKGQRCACGGGSDHGMTDNGNHGGSSYEETDSLVLFVGLKHKAYDCPLVIHSTADQTGNLLHIAIFNISYIRGLFPEKYFNDKSVPALRDQDQGAYTNGCKVLQTN